MKYSTLLILTLIFPLSSLAKFQAYFSPETPLDQVLVAEIRQSQASVDMSVYTFSSPDMVKELEAAMKRGVKVRLVARNSVEKMNPIFLKPLKDLGAEVRVISKINHHKFMIIDKRVLLNSSANFSQTGLQRSYDENLVRCDACESHIKAFQEEFDYLFQNSNRLDTPNDATSARMISQRAPEPKRPVALFTSRNYNPEFSENRGSIQLKTINDDDHGVVESALIQAIKKSKTSLQIATGHFRSYPLLTALAEAVRRGVQVQLILDSQEYVSIYKHEMQQKESEDCQLKKTEAQCLRYGYHLSREAYLAGVDVRIKSYALRWNFMKAPQMHHKYMIVDGKTVYSGSYNWSYNAEFQSAENILISSDPTLARAFQVNFQKLLNYGQGQFIGTRDQMRAAQAELPYLFGPLTLTYPELDEIRGIACEKCPDVFCSADNDDREEKTPAPTDRCLVKRAS